jgi:hypothetical protein
VENFFARFFWDQDSILLIDYVPKDQTINVEYYSSLLVQFKGTLKEKRRGKVTKGILFFHDKDLPHRVLASQNKLPTWTSSFFLTHPILRIWPRRTTTYSLD